MITKILEPQPLKAYRRIDRYTHYDIPNENKTTTTTTTSNLYTDPSIHVNSILVINSNTYSFTLDDGGYIASHAENKMQ